MYTYYMFFYQYLRIKTQKNLDLCWDLLGEEMRDCTELSDADREAIEEPDCTKELGISDDDAKDMFETDLEMMEDVSF